MGKKRKAVGFGENKETNQEKQRFYRIVELPSPTDEQLLMRSLTGIGYLTSRKISINGSEHNCND